ncbi:MAG TPA: lysophospholipid acyltransferase family protein [Thermoanaerobaculia bacterium]|nr:lysophospholipid acyltransferase family protein [Thermoanaerobaculia bacterium]
MTTRQVITAALRFCVRIFYRRIEMVGLERVPDGAVIFAVNHPNGLVDPLFLLCFAPRPVSFLAKAPLFGYPVIGWFARAFDGIPVYRRQDNTTGSNRETFARAREVLQHGGSIAIFPEGTTHDDPRLRELKTGVARIALGANLDALAVIPTGIYYTAKHVFRSNALVMFGKPLPVEPGHVDANGEPPPQDVERLTAAIDDGLDAVTLQADSHAALELIGRAEDIFTADAQQPLAEELELRRRFVEGYHYLRAHDPARLERLQSAIAQFESELRRAKLDVHELTPRIDALRLFRVLVLLPLALLGAFVSYPTYRLIGVLARRFSKGEGAMIATTKFLSALALYPLTYLALALLAGWRFTPTWGVATAIALPLLGYIALRVFEDIDDVIGDLRVMFAPREHLVQQRIRIREEFVGVAEELEAQRLTGS